MDDLRRRLIGTQPLTHVTQIKDDKHDAGQFEDTGYEIDRDQTWHGGRIAALSL
jgi:hypothetical protein